MLGKLIRTLEYPKAQKQPESPVIHGLRAQKPYCMSPYSLRVTNSAFVFDCRGATICHCCWSIARTAAANSQSSKTCMGAEVLRRLPSSWRVDFWELVALTKRQFCNPTPSSRTCLGYALKSCCLRAWTHDIVRPRAGTRPAPPLSGLQAHQAQRYLDGRLQQLLGEAALLGFVSASKP